MQFDKGFLYHIYNQGNNKQKIFFKRDNYLFFLKKIRVYVLPYADILAWCLMPNHFHLMVLVNEVMVSPRDTVGVALSDTDGKIGPTSHTDVKQVASDKLRTFNDSIGIMLRSYTNAINKQEKRSGKLFREATKAECLNMPNGVTPSFFNT